MFSIGECIAYGAIGICRVADICASPFDAKDTRRFYVLKSVAEQDRTIYTPTEMGDTVGRPPYTAEALTAIFSCVEEVEPLVVGEEKHRKDVYRTTMTNPLPEACVKMLKTVACRRATCAQLRKHLPAMDSEYEGLAKKLLLQEMMYAFSITAAEADGRLRKILERL